jgi:hypothetical protein
MKQSCGRQLSPCWGLDGNATHVFVGLVAAA